MSFSLTRSAAVAALASVVCFLVAGAVGQNQDGWLGDALPQWLGNVAWAGFLLGLLATALLGMALLVRRVIGRRPADGGPAISGCRGAAPSSAPPAGSRPRA